MRLFDEEKILNEIRESSSKMLSFLGQLVHTSDAKPSFASAIKLPPELASLQYLTDIPGNRLICLDYKTKELIVIKAETGGVEKRIKANVEFPVYPCKDINILYLSNGLVVLNKKQHIEIWDLEQGIIVNTLADKEHGQYCQQHRLENKSITSAESKARSCEIFKIQLIDDFLIEARTCGVITGWDTANQSVEIIFSIQHSKDQIRDFCTSIHYQIATCGECSVKVWDLQKIRCTKQFWPETIYETIAYLPASPLLLKGRQLLFEYTDKNDYSPTRQFRVIDLKTKQDIKHTLQVPFDTQTCGIGELADGRVYFKSKYRSNLCLYDAQLNNLIEFPKVEGLFHGDVISSMRFGPQFFSIGNDGNSHSYDKFVFWNIGLRNLCLSDIRNLFITLKTNTQIQYLDLRNVNLIDTDVSFLLEIFNSNKTLLFVDLRYTKLTMQGLRALEAGIEKRMPKLFILSNYTTGFSFDTLSLPRSIPIPNIKKVTTTEKAIRDYQSRGLSKNFDLEWWKSQIEKGLQDIDLSASGRWDTSLIHTLNTFAIKSPMTSHVMFAGRLYTGHEDGSILLWDFDNGTSASIQKPTTHQTDPNGLRYSLDFNFSIAYSAVTAIALAGENVISGYGDGTLYLHDKSFPSAILLQPVMGKGGEVFCKKLEINSNGQLAYLLETVSLSGENKHMTVTLKDHEYLIDHALFFGHMKQINAIKNNKDCFKPFAAEDMWFYEGLSGYPWDFVLLSEQLAIYNSVRNEIRIYATKNKKLLHTLKRSSFGKQIDNLRISKIDYPGSTHLGVFCENRNGQVCALAFWDLQTSKVHHTISLEASAYRNFSYVTKFRCLLVFGKSYLINNFILSGVSGVVSEVLGEHESVLTLLSGGDLITYYHDKNFQYLYKRRFGLKPISIQELQPFFLTLYQQEGSIWSSGKNRLVKTLNLENAHLFDEDIITLATLLMNNRTITQLNLRKTLISSVGIGKLRHLIRKRQTKVEILSDPIELETQTRIIPKEASIPQLIKAPLISLSAESKDRLADTKHIATTEKETEDFKSTLISMSEGEDSESSPVINTQSSIATSPAIAMPVSKAQLAPATIALPEISSVATIVEVKRVDAMPKQPVLSTTLSEVSSSAYPDKKEQEQKKAMVTIESDSIVPSPIMADSSPSLGIRSNLNSASLNSTLGILGNVFSASWGIARSIPRKITSSLVSAWPAKQESMINTTPAASAKTPEEVKETPTKSVPENKERITVSEIPFKQLVIDKELGRGGFGIVNHGTWCGTTVAIKRPLVPLSSKESIEEFNREATIMAGLRNPNIVQFYGYCPSPHYCLVMEYMPNDSLYRLLHNSGHPLDSTLKYRFVVDIANGLTFLHANNILHRDLKSLNILLNEHFQAKLCDFGLSKVKSESRNASTKGNAKGTPAWMAPESMELEPEFTKKSDIYSFAMVVWEIYSRKLPFAKAAHHLAIMISVREGKREEIPADCPKKMASLISRCWLANPKDRPDIEDVVNYLKSDREEFKF